MNTIEHYSQKETAVHILVELYTYFWKRMPIVFALDRYPAAQINKDDIRQKRHALCTCTNRASRPPDLRHLGSTFNEAVLTSLGVLSVTNVCACVELTCRNSCD